MSNFSFEPLKLKLATNNIIIPMQNGVADLTNAETSAKIMLAGKELFPIFDESIGGRNLIIQRDLILGYITSAGRYPSGQHPGSTPDNNITTDFIDVSGFDSITLTLFEDVPSPAGIGRMYAYDEQKNPLRLLFTQTSSTFTQKNSIKIEIGADVKYIAATLMKVNVLRYKLEKGNKATDWSPAPEDIFQNATLTSYNCSAAIVGDLVKITSHKPGTARGWVDVTVNYGNLSNTKRLNWSVEGVEPYKPLGTLLTMNNKGIKL